MDRDGFSMDLDHHLTFKLTESGMLSNVRVQRSDSCTFLVLAEAGPSAGTVQQMLEALARTWLDRYPLARDARTRRVDEPNP